MAFVLGIDKGSSVVRAVVFDDRGHAVGTGVARVPALSSLPGRDEEDRDAAWSHAAAAVRTALSASGVDPAAVRGVGIAGPAGGLWAVGRDGRLVRNAIGGSDGRAAGELADLRRSGAFRRIVAISGTEVMPGSTALLMGWIARHEPEALARTAVALAAKDWLRLRLTGEAATDPSDLAFVPGDVDRGGHSDEILALCGAGDWSARLPPVLPSGEIAGQVTAVAAAETGLHPGTPVVTGLSWVCATALGAGCLDPGQALSVQGAECLVARVQAVPDRAPAGLGFLCPMPGGRFLRVLPGAPAAPALDWFLDRFGGPRTAAGGWDFAAIEAALAAIPRGAGGVVFLPFLDGCGLPEPAPGSTARAAFLGADSGTTREHLLRALCEGLCFATRDGLAAMVGDGGDLVLTGRGRQGPIRAQMLADVCNMPVAVAAGDEVAALGVALLAGVATGVWADLGEARAAAIRTARRHAPDPRAAADYDDWFALYRTARDVARPRFAARAALAAAGTGTGREAAP